MGSSTSSSKLLHLMMSQAMFKIRPIAWGNIAKCTARGLHDLPTYNSNVKTVANGRGILTSWRNGLDRDWHINNSDGSLGDGVLFIVTSSSCEFELVLKSY